MAIKSKSTDKKQVQADISFSGLISWLGMMFLLYLLFAAASYLIISAFMPSFICPYNLSVFISYFSNQSYQDYDAASSLAALSFLAFLLMIIFPKKRRAFQESLADSLRPVWVEVKLAVIAGVVILSVYSSRLWLILLCIMLILYFLCLDLGHNRQFFRRNIVSTILDSVNRGKRMRPFELTFSRRLNSTICVISGVILVAAALFAVFFYSLRKYLIHDYTFYTLSFSLILFAIIGVAGTVSWYSLKMKKDSRDLSLIIHQIEKMYAGDLDAVNHVAPTSTFYDVAMQLNMIRTGIQKAVDDGIKADRTKVELITNVSHDIKTPLTSIISYIELLKSEDELSDTARDYISTISDKADRLSHIVQDVFEISKAATGNLNLDINELDLCKLLQQTLAEMDEVMESAPISWRVELPDSPVIIEADGQKLYRVFQNLVRNCSQYSLEGSRAYISLNITAECATVAIRNISKEELDPAAAEYLTGRFVRGDSTRSSEGSGLGLSIAKSFTEACGGKFILRTDVDVFYIFVQFPLKNKSVIK